MTKQEFVDKVATKSGLTRTDAGKAVEAFMDTVTEALTADDSVAFPGFGKFSLSQRAERTGINPQTRETMTIAATRVPKFTAGTALKKAVK